MEQLRKKAKAYWRYKHALDLLGLAVSIAYLAAIQFTGISSALADFCLRLSGNFYLAFSIYFAVIGLAYHILTLALNFYDGFALEHKFSLSNQGIKDWFKEDAKRWFVSTPISLALVLVFYAAARNFPNAWWIVSSLAWALFSVFFANVFPVLIIPLFYKCSILKNSELRSRVLEQAERFNIKLMDVYEIDFSKNTKKANAAVVGWGNTRRVILADNLVNEFTPDEITVVIAHEMAHYKMSHVWKLLAMGGASSTIFFFAIKKTFGAVSQALMSGGPFDMAVFPAILIAFIIYNLISAPVQNAISRTMEANADALALRITRLKGPFISLMQKLASKNLADADPNILVELLMYDHPPIAKRIRFAQTFKG